MANETGEEADPTAQEVRSSAELSEFQREYLIEEMKAARTRIDEEIKTMNQFEILSIAAIWTTYWAFFSFSVKDHAALVLLTFIPFVVCVYGVFRYRAHADVVRIHERYIKLYIERSVFTVDSKPQGLVRYYDRRKRSLLKFARYTFWWTLLFLSFALLVIAVACPEILTRIHVPKQGSL
jgi:hypothetical protein